MDAEKYSIVYQEKLSILEVARHTGLDVEEIRKFFRRGLIKPVEKDPAPIFGDNAVLRINRILRLQRDLGVNMDSMEVVLDLLDRVEQLEEELRRLA